MKLSVIGGGSTYTPELIHGFLSKKESCISEIALFDIDASRIEIVGGFCKKMAENSPSSIKINICGKINEALRNADFVVTQIRVGKNITRAEDEKFISGMNLIAQETTGAVGFMKAFRTIPAMISIVKKVQKICPDAFLINFTNPAGIITSAVFKATRMKKLAGLCNVPIFVQKKLVELLNNHDIIKSDEVLPEDVEMLWGGLNHLSWLFDFQVRGVSYFDEILDIMTDDAVNLEPYFFINKKYSRRINAIPSPYLRYYTDTDSIIREQAEKPLRGAEVVKIEDELIKIYKKKQK